MPAGTDDVVLEWPGDLLAKRRSAHRPMSTYRVTGIAVENPDWRHEHITHLLLEDRAWVTRDTAAVNILNPYGDRYYTYAKGMRADVVVVGCPVCGFSRYLRTKADSSTENNLLSLPKYPRAA